MSLDLMNLKQFLDENNITIEYFNNCEIKWDTLKEIGLDHSSKFEQLEGVAESFAKTIQREKKVHSVRYRVKDPQHLMEKIVRKTNPNEASYNDNYLNITKDNYHEIITDLIGIRALHLFKDDCYDINDYLLNTWNTKEKPTYYYRDGDEISEDLGIFSAKIHPAGYRSIHYIFESQPLKQKIYTEVQVRTIFEEAWSEIDHKIRYPNFSDNEQVSYFLRIFNRLAGSADEMGSFVKELINEFEANALELQNVKRENEQNIAEIDRLFEKINSSNGKHNEQNALIKDLEYQVQKFKKSTPKNDHIYITNNNKNLREPVLFSFPEKNITNKVNQK